jgi:hypothetical protein
VSLPCPRADRVLPHTVNQPSYDAKRTPSPWAPFRNLLTCVQTARSHALSCAPPSMWTVSRALAQAARSAGAMCSSGFLQCQRSCLYTCTHRAQSPGVSAARVQSARVEKLPMTEASRQASAVRMRKPPIPECRTFVFSTKTFLKRVCCFPLLRCSQYRCSFILLSFYKSSGVKNYVP